MAAKKEDSRACRQRDQHGALAILPSPNLFLQLPEQIENVLWARSMVAPDYPSMAFLAQRNPEEQESLHTIHVLEESLGQVGVLLVVISFYIDDSREDRYEDVSEAIHSITVKFLGDSDQRVRCTHDVERKHECFCVSFKILSLSPLFILCLKPLSE